MTVQLTARNASTEDLLTILNSQQAAKLDVVAPAVKIKSKAGNLWVADSVAQLTDDGVTLAAGEYIPTAVCDNAVADRLNIGRTYMGRMRETGRTDLIDGNVNGLLHGKRTGDEIVHAADPRAFLLRLFKGDDGQPGVARTILSDRYALTMDNLDVLTAVLSGIRQAGVQPYVRVSDLSETRMRVRFEFPDLYQDAEGLLKNYTSPFEGGRIRRAGGRDLEALRRELGAHHIFSDADAPIAYMGFDLDNSETGGGAYNLTPVVSMLKCTNGWVMTREGTHKVHRGAILDKGIVRYQADTIAAAGKTIALETRDTVSQWLTQDYLSSLVTSIETKAAVQITSPTEVVPKVCLGVGLSKEESKSVLDFFILSGQMTAGGIGQAITAYAQTVEDPDRAFDIERLAMPALEAAAKA